MAEDTLKNKTLKGIIWSSAERFGIQGIQFLTMLIMARLLTPEDYGILGILLVFITIAQVFVDSGFSQALIRKENRSEIDNSTVFYFNIVVSVFLYGILFLLAPFIEKFYKMPMLALYTRVIGVIIIVNSLTVVQVALYSAAIDFKTQAKASFISIFFSGAIGIALAYMGYGPWALVWQQISNRVINAIVLWVYSSWYPVWAYSWESFLNLFSFGSKLLATGIINAIYDNIYTIVIGKLYSATSLGLYSRANHFAGFPSGNFTSVFQRVTFPILCKVQDDISRMEIIYRKMIRCSVYIIFPCMVLLAAMSKPVVLVTIGEQWVECAYLLTILCFGLMWYPVHAINLDILQVSGRSDLFLKLEIYKKIIGFTVLAVSAPFGIVMMCYGTIISSLICLYVNTYYSSRILGITLWSQIKDLIPSLLLSLFIFILLLFLNLLVSNPLIQLIVGTIVGTFIYIGISKICKFPELDYLIDLIKRHN